MISEPASQILAAITHYGYQAASRQSEKQAIVPKFAICLLAGSNTSSDHLRSRKKNRGH